MGTSRAAARAAAAGCVAGALLFGAGPGLALTATGAQAAKPGPQAVMSGAQAAKPGPQAVMSGAQAAKSGPPGPAPPVPPGPGGPADLLITVSESPSSPEISWSLTCNPDGGTHPNPVLACQTLSAVRDPFAPVPAGVMCSMIYYGPQTATVTGYWQGQPVSARFSRVNGCEEQRWEKIATVLVIPVPEVPANPGGPIRPAPATPAGPRPGSRGRLLPSSG